MIANSRQVEKRHLLELEHRLFFGWRQILQIGVVTRIIRRAAEIVVPVRTRLYVDGLTRDQGHRAGSRLIITGLGFDEVQILICEWLIVIIDDRQARVMKNISEALQLAGTLELDGVLGYVAAAAAVAIATAALRSIGSAITLFLPATLLDILVFPLARVTGTGLGLDIVPPLILSSLAVGPDVLAGNRASVAANTFV